MTNPKTRVAILVGTLALIAVMLACGTGGLIGREEPSATPTKTPKPTFTATPIPTDTPVPTNTPLPTDTPTPEPPTNTPVIMTATFTPEPPTPTFTPIPPTNTPKPTARPRPKPTSTPTPRPAPTNTPRPAFEFSSVRIASLDTANCGITQVKGTIRTRSNAGMPSISVAVWATGWEGTVSNPSTSTGYWEVLLNNLPQAGDWHVRVVDPATCAPKAGGGPTPSANCTGWRSDEIVVRTTANCTGAGAVQVPVVDFKQN